MSELVITPNLEKKTAKVKGAIAGGEHVEVTLKYCSSLLEDGLRLRILDCKNTVAVFPLEENDTFTVDDSDLKFELNLNTTEMLDALKGAIEKEFIFILDNPSVNVRKMYFTDNGTIQKWVLSEGNDIPVDLDDYPTLFTKFDERINDLESNVRLGLRDVETGLNRVDESIQLLDNAKADFNRNTNQINTNANNIAELALGITANEQAISAEAQRAMAAEQALRGLFTGFRHFEKYPSLAKLEEDIASLSTQVIYLVPAENPSPDKKNILDGYAVLLDDNGNRFLENMGSSDVDLSGYPTHDDLETVISDFNLRLGLYDKNIQFETSQGTDIEPKSLRLLTHKLSNVSDDILLLGFKPNNAIIDFTRLTMQRAENYLDLMNKNGTFETPFYTYEEIETGSMEGATDAEYKWFKITVPHDGDSLRLYNASYAAPTGDDLIILGNDVKVKGFVTAEGFEEVVTKRILSKEYPTKGEANKTIWLNFIEGEESGIGVLEENVEPWAVVSVDIVRAHFAENRHIMAMRGDDAYILSSLSSTQAVFARAVADKIEKITLVDQTATYSETALSVDLFSAMENAISLRTTMAQVAPGRWRVSDVLLDTTKDDVLFGTI